MDVGDWQKDLKKHEVLMYSRQKIPAYSDAEISYGTHIAQTYHGFIPYQCLLIFILKLEKTLDWVKEWMAKDAILFLHFYIMQTTSRAELQMFCLA
jgi:hypothetical protein